MILKMMLDFDDFEDNDDDDGFLMILKMMLGLMILKMMLDFDDFDDDVGFWSF